MRIMRVVCEIPTYGEVDERIEEGVTLRIMNNHFSDAGPFIQIETPETIYQVKAVDLYMAVQRTRNDL